MLEERRHPSGRYVAVAAVIVRLDMIERFSGRTDTVVAFAATDRCPFELTPDMATIACHFLVRAGQREAGGEMIELELLRVLRSGGMCGQDRREQDQDRSEPRDCARRQSE